jgi:hypothetical protein
MVGEPGSLGKDQRVPRHWRQEQCSIATKLPGGQKLTSAAPNGQTSESVTVGHGATSEAVDTAQSSIKSVKYGNGHRPVIVSGLGALGSALSRWLEAFISSGALVSEGNRPGDVSIRIIPWLVACLVMKSRG